MLLGHERHEHVYRQKDKSSDEEEAKDRRECRSSVEKSYE